MEPRLSLITLGVADLARSRKFYGDGLGFPLQPQSNEHIAFYRLNGLWLALFSREALAEDAQVSAAGSGFAGFTLAHNVRTREEVIEVLAQIERLGDEFGGRIVKPAQDVFWGGFTGYFADPDGFLWEVAHNPHFWIE